MKNGRKRVYENIIIFLMGFAGCGKLTTAKELVKHSNFKLVDAHTISNPILNLIDLNNGILNNDIPNGVWDRVAPIRDAILDTIENLSPEYYSFVFTCEMIKDDAYSKLFFSMVKKVAVSRKALLIPVRLMCDEAALVQRVQNVDRALNCKTTDFQRSIRQSKNEEVFFSGEPAEISINNTHLSPKEVSDQILSYINKLTLL